MGPHTFLTRIISLFIYLLKVKKACGHQMYFAKLFVSYTKPRFRLCSVNSPWGWIRTHFLYLDFISRFQYLDIDHNFPEKFTFLIIQLVRHSTIIHHITERPACYHHTKPTHNMYAMVFPYTFETREATKKRNTICRVGTHNIALWSTGMLPQSHYYPQSH